MKTTHLERPLCYDGSQLRSHWILTQTGLVGDALVAWRGPCRVVRDEIADLADLDGPGIRGDDMLHFVMERFDDGDLERAVLRQRLFVALARELVGVLAPLGTALRREGDDLFVGEGKLSISIATKTPCSTMIHFALNVTTAGTPVRTACLHDLGIDPRSFADRLLAMVVAEEASIHEARCKVRAKGETSA